MLQETQDERKMMHIVFVIECLAFSTTTTMGTEQVIRRLCKKERKHINKKERNIESKQGLVIYQTLSSESKINGHFKGVLIVYYYKAK